MHNIVEITFGIAFFLQNLNLICWVLFNRIFVLALPHKPSKDMSVFQLKMQSSKTYSLGHWFYKGEKGYAFAIFFNVFVYGMFLYIIL